MENLGIDGKLLVAQIINFAVFYFVFKRFLAKPFSRFIDEEKEKEKRVEKALLQAKKQEEEILRKQEEFRTKIRKETEEILSHAKTSAGEAKQEILAQAAQEAEAIREKTKKALAQERHLLENEIRKKVIALSFFLVSRALGDVLTDETRKKTTQAILKNLPKKLTTHEN